VSDTDVSDRDAFYKLGDVAWRRRSHVLPGPEETINGVSFPTLVIRSGPPIREAAASWAPACGRHSRVDETASEREGVRVGSQDHRMVTPAAFVRRRVAHTLRMWPAFAGAFPDRCG
jgi:hypothetical protein